MTRLDDCSQNCAQKLRDEPVKQPSIQFKSGNRSDGWLPFAAMVLGRHREPHEKCPYTIVSHPSRFLEEPTALRER